MSEQSFNFDALTPDLMWYALESVGIRAESGLLALNSYENRVYQFTDEERQRYVVKFYRPQRWTTQQIQEEHDFTLELVEAEIPVAAPLKINGETLHHYQGYVFAVFPSVGGRQFEVDNYDQLEAVGRYLGRIHKVGSRTHFQHRPTIGIDEYMLQPRKLLQESQFIPLHLENAFFNDLDMLIQAVSQQWKGLIRLCVCMGIATQAIYYGVTGRCLLISMTVVMALPSKTFGCYLMVNVLTS
ncbi:YihE protein a ser/thr kinase implicated in LPS synthesis and Cpx signalling [Vibrio astriarenae]|nr:YihE protein a ser/thr kinase implicated in LPS synthesis and Cpx signalling [Vibrio sp. C7]